MPIEEKTPKEIFIDRIKGIVIDFEILTGVDVCSIKINKVRKYPQGTSLEMITGSIELELS